MYSCTVRVVALITLAAAFLGLPSLATADILVQYHLGEAGSLAAGNIPLDSSGNGHDFEYSLGAGSVSADHAPVAGSTASLSSAGYYSAENTAVLPTDNFSIGFWAKTSNTTQESTLFESCSTVPYTAGSLKIGTTNGCWYATYAGMDWIGAAAGAGQTLLADTWQHVEVTRLDGVSTLYIDGVAQTYTSTATPSAWNNLHLGTSAGGSGVYSGLVDELTISSVPEPSAVVLAACGLISLLAYAWRSRK